ncbi:importin beta-5 [Niveomyces insectorum RCEF 264]|uniref:Importin beta-5 n=1 Tax=Niveomyces insectorum RCEF 264 TaxID=1081102 RepID=A0A167PVP4_9HYPO|nr:importin beta-5 [Niveomyces insectorum RCEF 264]
MDDIVRLLNDTQRPEEGPRKQAELDLKHAQTNPSFPGLLTAIAASSSYPTQIRQSALSVLRQFIERNWTGGDEDDEDEDGDEAGAGGRPRIAIADGVKQELRLQLLELATRDEDDRRVKAAVSFVVGKIASVDYPDRWPDLLDSLLAVIRNGSDLQLHGALRVLGDLVDDGLSETQFFVSARSIVEVLYQVALSPHRKPLLRALAVSVFRSSFDLMDMVKDEHLKEVKGFAQEALQGWLPFFHDVVKMQLPPAAPSEGAESAGAAGGLVTEDGQQAESWNGLIALKLQVVKTLLKIKTVFSSLLLPQSPAFFEETWRDLSLLQAAYAQLYVHQDSQSRLEDADGLPYTLDFLVLEELDFLNQCIRAPPVQKELGGQLEANAAAAHETPWMVELMTLLVGYARITREEEDLWDIDVSLYLAEETSVTANYTARTACGDLLIKLGEWIGQRALEGLFARTRTLFGPAAVGAAGAATGVAAAPAGANAQDWRSQEASLYLFTMLAGDLLDCDKAIPDAVCEAYLQLIGLAVESPEPLLQARGYLAAGLLAETYTPATRFMDRSILAVTQAPSDLVQVACVKALDGFMKASSVVAAAADCQAPILLALREFLNARDVTDLEDADDLLATLCETLRRAISLNPAVVTSNDVPSVDLLFAIARCGARNFHVTLIVNESFEEIVRMLSDPTSYVTLCARVIPTLNGFFSFSDLTKDEPLVTLATELTAVLTQNGTEPLPAGFVAQVAPKLKRLLLESDEGEVLRPGAEALKYMLSHDHQQVFEWHDEQGNNGLVVCLQIVDRLLGPAVEDNAASEVGGLAAELVEKAGHQRLGDGMLQRLLEAVANRLSSAQTAPFIQSLILVFARLCLTAAGEVVGFLSQITVGQENGLVVVLSKWLENSMNFAGYDEIRQNVIALSKLYDLNDARIAQTLVKGDLIVPTSDRIMTRSRAKQSTPSLAHDWSPENERSHHLVYNPLQTPAITDFFTVPFKDPDQYTVIPAPLKILKLLIEELISAQGKLVGNAATLEAGGASAAAAAAAAALSPKGNATPGENQAGDASTAKEATAGHDDGDEDGGDASDDGWEDETDDLLDLSLGATKNDLFAYLDGNGSGGGSRMRDDETQAYLTEFFLRAAREDTAGFKGWYDQLTPQEQAKLNELAGP